MPLLAALLAAALASVVTWRLANRPAPLQLVAALGPIEAGEHPRDLVLSDGSRIRLAAQAAIDPLTNQPDRFELSLRAGSARFEMVGSRAVVVQSGAIRALSSGTVRFAMEAGANVSVELFEGELRVENGAHAQTLSAGERLTVP